MDLLTVRNANYQGSILGNSQTYEVLKNFSYEFHFGKAYLLNAMIGEGAWALSWIIGGAIQQTEGTIEKNGEPYTIKDRKENSWLVHTSEVKRFGIFTQSVQKQIRHGLRTKRGHYLLSENDYFNRFNLSIERYNRPLRQFSNEGWRASCAVGMANAKSIFCFPHIEPKFITEHRHLWFDELLDLLKSSGALVLCPTPCIDELDDLCDEVVDIQVQVK